MESSKVSGKNRDVGNPEKQYRIKVKQRKNIMEEKYRRGNL